MKRTTLALATTLTLVIGCSGVDDTTPDNGQDGFEVVQHDATTLEATLHADDSSLSLLVVEHSPGVIDLTFDFDETIIGFSIDYNKGTGRFMPDSGTLDAATGRLLDRMLVELRAIMPTESDQRTRVEHSAIQQVSFMQIVPAGETLVEATFVAVRGWTHIGCSCTRRYIGSGYYRVTGKGNGCTGGSGNGCKGRCGVGCGYRSRGAYTRDCAKHDYGVGSWWSASDDFSFAGWNCGYY